MTTNNIPGRTGRQLVVMDYSRICRWLNLPENCWPPDHYTLLGLEIGLGDLSLIESKSQERLRQVRSYQLTHPELATEAMNRLAQAYACLSDPKARKKYDAACGFNSQATVETRVEITESPVEKKPNPSDDTVTGGLPTVLAWKEAVPPPVRRSENHSQPAEEAAPLASQLPAQDPLSPAGQPTPTLEPETPATSLEEVKQRVDPILKPSIRSWKARKGLNTPGLLTERIYLTQKLQSQWQGLSIFLKAPSRPLKTGEEKYFRKKMTLLDELIEELPELLGEPGQPGYRVAILARDEDPVKAIQTMEMDEREFLTKDWNIGLTLIQTHLQFLQTELEALHRANPLAQLIRPIRVFINKHAFWFYTSLLVFVFLVIGLWFRFVL